MLTRICLKAIDTFRISFEHPDIKALCTELKIPAIAIPLLKQDVEPRDLYTMAVIQIIQYFFQKKFLKKQNRFTIPDDVSLIASKIVKPGEEPYG